MKVAIKQKVAIKLDTAHEVQLMANVLSTALTKLVAGTEEFEAAVAVYDAICEHGEE